MNKIGPIIVIISALFVWSCRERATVTVTEIDSNVAAGSTSSRQTGYLLFNSARHAFSDPKKLDSFVIAVTGGSLLDAQVRFEIFDYAGRSVYRDSFASGFLLGYGVSFESSDVEKQAFVQKRVREFFAPQNFIIPAINENDNIHPDNISDTSFWNELKAMPSAIGFYYLLGKEDGRFIGYSRLRKKALLYRNCC